ncbi:hypothetical protein FKM82_004666 [Ascaphus truei]
MIQSDQEAQGDQRGQSDPSKIPNVINKIARGYKNLKGDDTKKCRWDQTTLSDLAETPKVIRPMVKGSHIKEPRRINQGVE